MQKYALEGPITAGGGITLPFLPEGGVPWLFKGLFGTVESTQAASGVYDHSFIAGAVRRLPSFTLRVDDGTTAQNWLGCTVGNISFTFRGHDPVECNTNIVSQRPHEADDLLEAPTFSGLGAFTGADLSFTLNGETNLDFQQFTLAFRNEIEPVFTHSGNRWCTRHHLRSFAAGGSVTLRFSTDAERRRLWGALDAEQPQRVIQPGSVSVSATHPSEAAPGYNYSFSASFPEIYYRSAPANVLQMNDFVTQEIQFLPVAGVSRDRVADVTIRNSESGYPG